MNKPMLYLMVGYPGAGKTTVARVIAEQTGAMHLWADLERNKIFGHPTHSETESRSLYRELNNRVEKLLATGKSVVFDTNFNYRRDRQLLRSIANQYDAETVVVWVATLKDTARERAVSSKVVRNGYNFTMSTEQFDAIANKLEPPRSDEKVIKIDSEKFDLAAIIRLIKEHA